jgi:hypothetical protein
MKLRDNGVEADVDDRDAATPLLWVRRENLGPHGTTFGPDTGVCEACTVLLDDRNTKPCQTVTERAVGEAAVTVQGAAGPTIKAVRDAWCRRDVVRLRVLPAGPETCGGRARAGKHDHGAPRHPDPPAPLFSNAIKIG